MRLQSGEKEIIKEWWETDLDIELDRSRYTAVLKSDVSYAHHSDGSYDRLNGSKRGVQVIPSHGRMGEYLINPQGDDSLESPEDAIKWLDEKGSLLGEAVQI